MGFGEVLKMFVAKVVKGCQVSCEFAVMYTINLPVVKEVN